MSTSTLLQRIDQVIWCVDNALKTKNENIPRTSFPNTTLEYQCRNYDSLFTHVRTHLEYQNFQWFSTCLRVKYPQKTVDFFVQHFGMVLLQEYHFADLKTSFYMLVSPTMVAAAVTTTAAASDSSTEANATQKTKEYPKPGTKAAEDLLYNYTDGNVLQLRYEHGSDTDDTFEVNSGNVKPFRGFGHIAFNTDDVYGSCDTLIANGVPFRKKPNDGRMKGLAFCLDPNGYWIEIVSRDVSNTDSDTAGIANEFNLSQTMIRVKNPEQSLRFYSDMLGMKLVSERHFPEKKRGEFSIYFMSSNVDHIDLHALDGLQRRRIIKNEFHAVLELTHNHGTEREEEEDDSVEEYHTSSNQMPFGFIHLGFLVNNLTATVQRLESLGCHVKELPKYLRHKRYVSGFTFLEDPDGYTIELIERGQPPMTPYDKDTEKEEEKEDDVMVDGDGDGDGDVDGHKNQENQEQQQREEAAVATAAVMDEQPSNDG